MRSRRDDGFTLIDSLIAISILGTVVVALVTGLTGLIASVQAHRGNAVAEAVTHSFVQAVNQKLMFSTALRSPLTPSGTSAVVADASGLAGLAYIAVEDEMMRVTAMSGNTLTVVRTAETPVAHPATAPVTAAFRCPGVTELTPLSGSWSAPSGVSASITAITYLDPASGSLEDSASTCGAKYDARCLYGDGSTGALNPWCDSGLERITVAVDTSGDPAYKTVTATTQLLVRRGSP